MYWFIWIGVLALSIIFEVITDQLFSVWFVPGAIICAILAYFNIHFAVQIVVFLAVSLVGIFVLRRFLIKHFKKSDSRTNIDAIIGEKCIVTEKINNFAGCGQVKVKGQIWSARGCSDEDEFDEGEILQIVAIEGVKLICKKI